MQQAPQALQRFAGFLANPWAGTGPSPQVCTDPQQPTSVIGKTSQPKTQQAARPLSTEDQPGAVSEAQVFERTFPRKSAASAHTAAQSSMLLPGAVPDADGKAELGRATWTLLHTLAAQYPDVPTRRQRKDTEKLIKSMASMYPCAECAIDFQAFVRSDPPRVQSRAELEQWTCALHNRVNRKLGKPAFNCSYVRSRWLPLDCDADSSCTLTGF